MACITIGCIVSLLQLNGLKYKLLAHVSPKDTLQFTKVAVILLGPSTCVYSKVHANHVILSFDAVYSNVAITRSYRALIAIKTMIKFNLF